MTNLSIALGYWSWLRWSKTSDWCFSGGHCPSRNSRATKERVNSSTASSRVESLSEPTRRVTGGAQPLSEPFTNVGRCARQTEIGSSSFSQTCRQPSARLLKEVTPLGIPFFCHLFHLGCPISLWACHKIGEHGRGCHSKELATVEHASDGKLVERFERERSRPCTS